MKLTLLTGNFYVFIIGVLIFLTIIVLYFIIQPSQSIPYNFIPFPEVAPTNLPSPTKSGDTCWTKLTPCDSEGECSSCATGKYKCVQVSQEDADLERYTFNGITVDRAGSFCLPQDNNTNPVCNMYTGRWTWVYDPEYCQETAPNTSHPGQCWKCECLYPSMYSNPKSGCTDQQVCQNRSPSSKSDFQPKNVLKATKYASKDLQGRIWDPISGDDTDILRFNPYSTDDNGNPLFACNCQDNSENQYFSVLPNDPYNCHLAPCYKYFGHTARGLNPECDYDSDAKCTCTCSTNQAISPNGVFAGTCVSIPAACQSGGWDETNQECTCQSPYFSVKCRSSVVNTDQTNLPICVNEDANALGSQCVNACEGNQCEHGTQCVAQPPPPGSPPGTLPTYSCNCDIYDQKDAPPNGWKWGGKRCEAKCLPEGTPISYKPWNGTNTYCYSPSCCCSGRERKESVSGFPKTISYKMVCDSGDSADNPGIDSCQIRNPGYCN